MKNLLKKVRAFIMTLFGFDENKNKRACVPLAESKELWSAFCNEKFEVVRVEKLKTHMTNIDIKGKKTQIISHKLEVVFKNGTTRVLYNPYFVIGEEMAAYPRATATSTTNNMMFSIGLIDDYFKDLGTIDYFNIELVLMRTDV